MWPCWEASSPRRLTASRTAARANRDSPMDARTEGRPRQGWARVLDGLDGPFRDAQIAGFTLKADRPPQRIGDIVAGKRAITVDTCACAASSARATVGGSRCKPGTTSRSRAAMAELRRIHRFEPRPACLLAGGPWVQRAGRVERPVLARNWCASWMGPTGHKGTLAVLLQSGRSNRSARCGCAFFHDAVPFEATIDFPEGTSRTAVPMPRSRSEVPATSSARRRCSRCRSWRTRNRTRV